MDAQELRNLQEAYMEVVENQQLGEGHRELNKKRMRRMDDQIIKHMDRDDWEKAGNIQNQMDSRTPEWSKMQAEKNKNRPEKEKRSKTVSEADLYDIVMDYLLDEGYADTQEAAEAIMANMSEDWREDIVEANAGPSTPVKIDPKMGVVPNLGAARPGKIRPKGIATLPGV